MQGGGVERVEHLALVLEDEQRDDVVQPDLAAAGAAAGDLEGAGDEVHFGVGLEDGYHGFGAEMDSIGALVHARHTDCVDALAVCASPLRRGCRALVSCNGVGLARAPTQQAEYLLVRSRASWIRLGGEDFEPTSTRPQDAWGES